MNQHVTLDNCAREPIHIPGSIQPHGVLLACRSESLVIYQASRNTETIWGRPASSLLGASVIDLVDVSDAKRIAAAIKHHHLREVSPLRVCISGAEYDISMHRSGDVIILEFEAATEATTHEGPGFDPRLRRSVARMQSASYVQALCDIAVEEIAAVTGFDRVMVYRFDADWNGEVVAEHRRPDLESFLGLHYPASDIPEQARRLYTVNWLRFISDIAYTPIPLEPTLDPVTAAPLDMSHAILRSVSPIHIEYLRNMGVTASMSVSLIIDGKLAGLIACHHYSGPRIINVRARDTSEFLGQTLSWQLRVLETSERARREQEAQEHESQIVRSLVNAADVTEGLLHPSLLSLVDADGVAIILHEQTRTMGACPPPEDVSALVAWLKDQPVIAANGVFVTASLAKAWPKAADWGDAAGLLAVPISRELGEFLLWFRRSTERTVNWAGNPEKAVNTPSPGAPPRLSPRGSFAL